MNGDFFDTNILVYAHDSSAGAKHEKAAGLVGSALSNGTFLSSVQVLMEFYVVTTKKTRKCLPEDEAAEIVSEFAVLDVFSPEGHDVVEACKLARKKKISLWDAMIIHAAAELGAKILWSEDLQNGFNHEGLVVKNPFS